MTTVFICYGREHQEQVRSLAQDLEDLGRAVWFDQALTGGQVWWDQILKKIRECEVFVFALSPLSLESQACVREYSYAAKLGKTILPVVVAEGVSDELLPEALAKIQYVDYQCADKAALRKLSKALNALPPSGPLPAQLPDPPAVPVSYLVGLREQIETSEQLSFEQQTSIVLRLKQRLRESKEVEQVADLLLRLRSRDDLYAKVGDEIDSLLKDVPAPSVVRKPVAEEVESPSPAQPTGIPGSTGPVKSSKRPAESVSVTRVEYKPLEERQTLLELVPAKIAWLALLTGSIGNSMLIRTIDPEWPMRYFIRSPQFWENSLVFAAALLVGYVVWRKVASKPLYYKLAFFWGPISFLVILTFLIGYLDPREPLFWPRVPFFWAKQSLALILSIFCVVIAFWKDTPSAPVPVKVLLAWLAAGLAGAVFVGWTRDPDIIRFFSLLVSAAVVLYVLGVSWRSLQALKIRKS